MAFTTAGADYGLLSNTEQTHKRKYDFCCPDWWCVRKRETSFSVNKLWLIYLPPSLWPITMKNRYACKV